VRARNQRTDVTDLDDQLIRHHHAAFGWALACCRWDPGMAEDVLQTAYLKLLDGRANHAEKSEFRGFLFGVIRRTASEERRRRALRNLLPTRLFDLRSDDGVANHPGVTGIVRDEESSQLIAALQRLPRRQSEVLHLVFYQDLSIASAAEVLGISVGSARVHYERGKAQLRRLLGDK
jgi:RNA polymerase sigma-70 factor (ECF subfamily)